jgi:hypothetical protein
MYKKILLNKELSIRNRIKNFILYTSRVKGARKSWNNRHAKLIKKNNKYIDKIDNKIEYKHEKLWRLFRGRVDISTMRICGNISGVYDYRYIPEDIFVTEVEPTLNNDNTVSYLSHKSFYNRWFENGIFPRDIFHNIDGLYLDSNLDSISKYELVNIINKINYPVVIKPNKDTYGGAGINFVKSSKELLSIISNLNNFVVQEMIVQHEFYDQFNSYGLNTFRVYLYRSVKDNKLHVISVSLRMGKDGTLDNETAGGIHTMIKDDGTMNGYAVDKFGTKFLKHPNSGLKFNYTIPDFKGLKSLALHVGSKIFLIRIIGLDLCYDEQGNWKVIEVNTKGHAVRFSQYGGKPFFGDFTDEVIEYCQNNHWVLR